MSSIFPQSIKLYLMTKKGFSFLLEFAHRLPSQISMVVTASDSAISDDYSEKIKQYCRERSIPCCDRLNDSEDGVLSHSYIIAISWRWLIHSADNNLIVLHDSILPRYRGFNPLVTALINGDTTIGVSVIQGVSKYDAVNIYYQSKSSISYPITIHQAIEVVCDNYRDSAIWLARHLSLGVLPRPFPQSDASATYSLWRDEEDYAIDQSQSADRLKRFVDATGYPYRGAMTRVDGLVMRVHEVSLFGDLRIDNRTPGKVVFQDERCPIVVCGEGLLRIDSASYEDGSSALPLPKFRVRFQ